jgi:putative heme-binding domain-containing protein
MFMVIAFVFVSSLGNPAGVAGQELPSGPLFRSTPEDSTQPDDERDLSVAETAEEAVTLAKQLPAKLSAAELAALREWDRRWSVSDEPEAKQLIALLTRRLAKSGDPRSLEYLHQVYESVPGRRQSIAIAVADYANRFRRRPQDWRLLVRSLPILEGQDSVPVLAVLARFSRRGTRPESCRQAILAGLRISGPAEKAACDLLRHWTGQPLDKLEDWQTWWHENYPDRPKAELPVDPPGSRYVYADLLQFLRSEHGRQGDPEAGARIYERAQCVRCHRFGDRGEAMGGDLTSASRKFQDKQLLESLLYPSQNIPEEYAAKIVLDKQDRRYAGVITFVGDKMVVLTTSGEKIEIARDQIQEIRPSNQSSMPSGLLDSLTQKEIADLFAYLLNPATAQAGY